MALTEAASRAISSRPDGRTRASRSPSAIRSAVRAATVARRPIRTPRKKSPARDTRTVAVEPTVSSVRSCLARDRFSGAYERDSASTFRSEIRVAAHSIGCGPSWRKVTRAFPRTAVATGPGRSGGLSRAEEFRPTAARSYAALVSCRSRLERAVASWSAAVIRCTSTPIALATHTAATATARATLVPTFRAGGLTRAACSRSRAPSRCAPGRSWCAAAARGRPPPGCRRTRRSPTPAPGAGPG